MSERWARAILRAYRLAGAAAYPLIGTYVAWRTSQGQGRPQPPPRALRHCRPARARPARWSGCMRRASARPIAVVPLIERILDYGINVVLTTGTVTSAQVADERLGDRIIHQYVPLDLKPAVSHFLDHWQPDLAIIAESEIWPMTILELGARRVPQVLVNGRLSDRSFASWKKRAFIAEALFENLAHVVAQSRDRRRALRLARRAAGDGVRQPQGRHRRRRRPTSTRWPSCKRQIGARRTWAAVSTHDGEEAVAAEVHGLLKPAPSAAC